MATLEAHQPAGHPPGPAESPEADVEAEAGFLGGRPRFALSSLVWSAALGLVVAAAVAAVVFYVPKSTPTAEARLIVGRLDVEAQAIPGYAAASDRLADTYSHLLTSGVGIQRLATRVGSTPAAVGPLISASAIPDSPIIRVIATGPTDPEAVKTAEAAAETLIDYVQSFGGTALPDDFLAKFQAASTDLERAKVAQTAAVAALDGFAKSTDQSAAEFSRLTEQAAQADVAVSLAQTKVDQYAEQYKTSRQIVGPDQSAVIISPAAPVHESKVSRLPVAGAAGLAAGGVAGLGLLLLLTRIRRR